MPPAARFSLAPVLLIIADDYGWNDVGYHTNQSAVGYLNTANPAGLPVTNAAAGIMRTPTIDRLANEGIKLEKYGSSGWRWGLKVGVGGGGWRWGWRWGWRTGDSRSGRRVAIPTGFLVANPTVTPTATPTVIRTAQRRALRRGLR